MNNIAEIFPIKEVTIFPESGRVKRSKSIKLKKGENVISIKKVPDNISVESVRVELTHPDKIKFLDIYTEDKFISLFDENKYKVYSEESDKLILEIKKIENIILNLDDEFSLFLKKEKLSQFFDSSRSKPINISNWEEFLKFMKEKLTDNRFKCREEIYKWLDCKSKLKSALDNLNKFQSYDQIKEHNVIIKVESDSDIEEIINIFYLQKNISWYPSYNIRADLNNKRLNITMFGMITQSTGEDWENVVLQLSTAVPNENCDIPELKSKRIKESHSEILQAPAAEFMRNDSIFDERSAVVMSEVYKESEKKISSKSMSRKSVNPKKDISSSIAGAAMPAVSPSPKTSMDHRAINKSIESQEMIYGEAEEKDSYLQDRSISFNSIDKIYRDYFQLMYEIYEPKIQKEDDHFINEFFYNKIDPSVSLGGFDHRYKVQKSKNLIPSINKPIQIPVETREIPMEIIYTIIPCEKELAYLKTIFTNEKTPLPSGPARIFLENDFLGNIMLPTLGVNQQTFISMGIDQDIKIIRKENSKQKSVGVVSKGILTDFEIEIEIKNNKSEKIKIEIYDRLPNSLNEKEVEILNQDYSVKPDKISGRNVIYWNKEIKSGGNLNLDMKYSVRHAENFRLILSKSDQAHYEF